MKLSDHLADALRVLLRAAHEFSEKNRADPGSLTSTLWTAGVEDLCKAACSYANAVDRAEYDEQFPICEGTRAPMGSDGNPTQNGQRVSWPCGHWLTMRDT